MLQYIVMEILLKLVRYVTVDRVSSHHSRRAWETEDMIHDSSNTVFSTANCGRHKIPIQRDFNLGHTLDVSPSVADKLTCNQFVT